MAQRFGRVNRYGKREDTEIHIVHPTEFDAKNEYELRQERTLELLRQLKSNASPASIGDLDQQARLDAFTPPPTTLDATDILFDAWALTTIKDKLPGRPSVEQYLHGISEWEPPETQVAWRKEVEVVKDDLLNIYDPRELIGEYPLKPHELLHDRTDRVYKHLQKIAEQHGDKPAWIVDDDTIEVTTLNDIAGKEQSSKDKDDLNGKIILLPPTAGGLENGLLNGDAKTADDVSDRWYVDTQNEQRRRIRVWDDEPIPKGMRLVRAIDIRSNPDDEDIDEEESSGRRYWRWYELPKSADSDGSKRGDKTVRWQPHTDDVSRNIELFIKQLNSLSGEAKWALQLAAKWHDLGKKRQLWQRSIGNPNPCDWLAKSGSKKKSSEITGYRHEFGSLLDIHHDAEFNNLSNDVQELVLHLIASHHGRARPHFPAHEVFDPESSETCLAEISQKILHNYSRLQRKYGRWGLAYLESVLRAADYAASADPTVTTKEYGEDAQS
jgi:CRISPR-associated endonuclease/helicase Cas3